MGKFFCPACKAWRHISEPTSDPREDHCWQCGTKVPYTPEEEQRWKEEMAPDE